VGLFNDEIFSNASPLPAAACSKSSITEAAIDLSSFSLLAGIELSQLLFEPFARDLDPNLLYGILGWMGVVR